MWRKQKKKHHRHAINSAPDKRYFRFARREDGKKDCYDYSKMVKLKKRIFLMKMKQLELVRHNISIAWHTHTHTLLINFVWFNLLMYRKSPKIMCRTEKQFAEKVFRWLSILLHNKYSKWMHKPAFMRWSQLEVLVDFDAKQQFLGKLHFMIKFDVLGSNKRTNTQVWNSLYCTLYSIYGTA